MEWDKARCETRVFGSKVLAHVPEQKCTKWDVHTVEGIHVEYCATSNGIEFCIETQAKLQ